MLKKASRVSRRKLVQLVFTSSLRRSVHQSMSLPVSSRPTFQRAPRLRCRHRWIAESSSTRSVPKSWSVRVTCCCCLATRRWPNVFRVAGSTKKKSVRLWTFGVSRRRRCNTSAALKAKKRRQATRAGIQLPMVLVTTTAMKHC